MSYGQKDIYIALEIIHKLYVERDFICTEQLYKLILKYKRRGVLIFDENSNVLCIFAVLYNNVSILTLQIYIIFNCLQYISMWKIPPHLLSN